MYSVFINIHLLLTFTVCSRCLLVAYLPIFAKGVSYVGNLLSTQHKFSFRKTSSNKNEIFKLLLLLPWSSSLSTSRFLRVSKWWWWWCSLSSEEHQIQIVDNVGGIGKHTHKSDKKHLLTHVPHMRNGMRMWRR